MTSILNTKLTTLTLVIKIIKIKKYFFKAKICPLKVKKKTNRNLQIDLKLCCKLLTIKLKILITSLPKIWG